MLHYHRVFCVKKGVVFDKKLSNDIILTKKDRIAKRKGIWECSRQGYGKVYVVDALG